MSDGGLADDQGLAPFVGAILHGSDGVFDGRVPGYG